MVVVVFLQHYDVPKASWQLDLTEEDINEHTRQDIIVFDILHRDKVRAIDIILP